MKSSKKLYLQSVAATSAEYSVGFSSGFGGSLETPINISAFTPETIEALKNALGYGDAIVKCTHCGQWAAVKTSCVHCGAPVG